MKILIADDDEITLELIENILQSAGHQTRLAVNGREGLRLMAEFRPDVVITDIEMPEMDGLEFLAAIRQLSEETIVLVATAHGNEQYALRALRARANDYLRKPFTPETLLPLMQKYANALETNNRVRRVTQFIMRSEMTLVFGNCLNLVGEIAEYLASQAVNLMPRDKLTMLRLALGELITNAIEHGNLEISPQMKSESTGEFGGYFEFLRQRQFDQRFMNRKVTVTSNIDRDSCEWIIRDEGPGFAWREFPGAVTSESFPSRNGRGVLLSRLQFDEMEFLGNGNAVRVKKYVRRSGCDIG